MNPAELYRAQPLGQSADLVVVETEGAISCNLGQLLISAERRGLWFSPTGCFCTDGFVYGNHVSSGVDCFKPLTDLAQR